MNTIDGLGSIYTKQPNAQAYDNSSGSSSSAPSTEFGKEAFLKLLVAQLKSQDPLNPMDNQAFVSQLATFSSLEQLISINEAVTKLTSGLG